MTFKFRHGAGRIVVAIGNLVFVGTSGVVVNLVCAVVNLVCAIVNLVFAVVVNRVFVDTFGAVVNRVFAVVGIKLVGAIVVVVNLVCFISVVNHLCAC